MSGDGADQLARREWEDRIERRLALLDIKVAEIDGELDAAITNLAIMMKRANPMLGDPLNDPVMKALFPPWEDDR